MMEDLEVIRGLAKLERDMDSGAQPFVLFGGHRLSVHPDVMTKLGLEFGQTVSLPIVIAICKENIAYCQEKMDQETFFSNTEISIG